MGGTLALESSQQHRPLPRVTVLWVAQDCHPSTQEVEAEGSQVQSCPQLRSEFEASLEYMKLYL